MNIRPYRSMEQATESVGVAGLKSSGEDLRDRRLTGLLFIGKLRVAEVSCPSYMFSNRQTEER